MNFKYICVQSLPKLAWCVQIANGNEEVTVFHGEGVEANTDFFAEGAWDGDFSAKGFIETSILCGTGCKLFTDKVKFSSSTDSLSPIFSIAKPGVLYVSNSPVFNLVMSDEEPDPIYPYYGHDLINIVRKGLHCPDGIFPTATGEHLHVHFNTIMSVTKDLSISFEFHPIDRKPQGYKQYKQYVQEGIEAVLNNGQHPSRRFPYNPMAFVSKGYDCNAMAALAASSGCREAATFIDSRHKNPRRDSGLTIAEQLGLRCQEYDRWSYLLEKKHIDADFAMFTFATNPAVSAIGSGLNQKILIGGNFGEIWDTNKGEYLDSFLVRPWIPVTSGLGHIEYRLKMGYLVFAPAYICARHASDILSITHSRDMDAWRVGGRYDKPIPRRILEEAGIQRRDFGMLKMGTSHAHFYKGDDLSNSAREDYLRFIKTSHSRLSKLKVFTWYVLTNAEFFLWLIINYSRRNSLYAPKYQNWLPIKLPGRRHYIPWKFMFMFQWAFVRLKSRYEITSGVVNQA